MTVLKLNIDTKAISDTFGELKNEVQKDLVTAVKNLAAATNLKAHEIAASELKTTSKKFRDALGFEEVSSNIWVVSLNEKMLWREEGKKPGSMVQDLLKNNPKIDKDGKKYKIIPFEHGGGPTETTPKAQMFLDILKKELKRRDIPYKKLELGTDGSPKVGKLHSFNVDSPRPSAKAKYPALHGVSIYQTPNKSGKIERHLMTFRCVKEGHEAEGLWYHPGLSAAKVLDKAFEFAEKTWESEILPSILEKYTKK